MNKTVSVIGLGYAGLPVAIAFGLRKRTIGFDINKNTYCGTEAGDRPHRRGHFR